MKDVDNLNGFPSYAVHNAVRCLNEFTNAVLFTTVNHSTKVGKGRQLITTLQDAIDHTVRGLLGFCENVTVDVGKRSQRPVRPDNIHFGMPSLFRISSLVRVLPVRVREMT